MKKFLAIFAVAGLVFASCENGATGANNTDSIEKAKKDSIELDEKAKKDALSAQQDTLGNKKDSVGNAADSAKKAVEAAH